MEHELGWSTASPVTKVYGWTSGCKWETEVRGIGKNILQIRCYFILRGRRDCAGWSIFHFIILSTREVKEYQESDALKIR